MKKVIIIVSVIAVLAITGACIYMFSQGSEDEPIVNDEVVETPAPTKTPIMPVPTPEPTPFVPTFDFDDNISIRITEKDYLGTDGDVSDDLTLEEKVTAYPVAGYEFSHGFIMLKSDKVTPVYTDDYIGICETVSDGFRVTIEELDALKTTVDDEIYEVLYSRVLVDYIECEWGLIPRNSNVTLGEGLGNWQELFPDSRTDPTVYGVSQVVVDSTEECSYGPVRYLCIYNSQDETFEAHAFVTCDMDRLLHIRVDGNVMRTCWSYVIEVTNNVIRIVK